MVTPVRLAVLLAGGGTTSRTSSIAAPPATSTPRWRWWCPRAPTSSVWSARGTPAFRR
ncbi:MAG: hypothetical protein U0802_02390 [Candidatus Binatia bacterium]